VGGSPAQLSPRAWYTGFFFLHRQISHSPFRRAITGLISHPTQVRTRGFLRSIWTGSRPSERDRLGMSGGAKPELIGPHLNLCRLFVPPARIHRRLSPISLSPSRALSWTPHRFDFMGDMVYVFGCRHTANTAQLFTQFHTLLQHDEGR